MTYFNQLNKTEPCIISSGAQQDVSAGLFEDIKGKQNTFNTQFLLHSSGLSVCLPVLALKSDGDANPPYASMSVANASTLSSRIASQVAPARDRTVILSNGFFTTNQTVSMSISVFDSGDQVYTDGFNMLIIPIKE
jgi:hypothetical protein